MYGNDKLRFWEQDYKTTTTMDVIKSDTIKEAHDILRQLEDSPCRRMKAYGDSALSDINLFCNLSSLQLLEGQIEHKLRRLKNLGVDGDTEDTLMDLMGYLTLFMVAVNRSRK